MLLVTLHIERFPVAKGECLSFMKFMMNYKGSNILLHKVNPAR
jgi:hypothetical protein